MTSPDWTPDHPLPLRAFTDDEAVARWLALPNGPQRDVANVAREAFAAGEAVGRAAVLTMIPASPLPEGKHAGAPSGDTARLGWMQSMIDGPDESGLNCIGDMTLCGSWGLVTVCLGAPTDDDFERGKGQTLRKAIDAARSSAVLPSDPSTEN